jgi:hypothetical protein
MLYGSSSRAVSQQTLAENLLLKIPYQFKNCMLVLQNRRRPTIHPGCTDLFLKHNNEPVRAPVCVARIFVFRCRFSKYYAMHINHSEVKPATICAKNQALNENIDKVIRILRQFSLIDIFVLKSGFTSEWLICIGRRRRTGLPVVKCTAQARAIFENSMVYATVNIFEKTTKTKPIDTVFWGNELVRNRSSRSDRFACLA